MRGVLAALFISMAGPTRALEVPDWPGLYDPFVLLTLNVETVEPTDFDLIRNDTTYDIEVPAWFWAEDEEPILVSIRRKSASALPNELDPNKKVSFKIDINEYHDDPDDVDICVDVPGITEGCVSKWKSVKKLSLENGDDQDVAQEGVAWYLHRLAAESGLDYDAGLASWVKFYVNGQYQGVYVNVEQPDKQFLKNRGLWEGGDDTWLYKMSDIDSPEAKEAPEDENENPIDSPASEAFCYRPFVDRGRCPAPADFKAQLEAGINMEGMLTYGAVTAFHYSPDDMFAKGKNFYYLDYSEGVGFKREYFQWDLDSAFGSLDPNSDMYSQGRGKHDAYEEALVDGGDAPFRDEYTAIIDYLLNMPVFDADSLALDQQAFEALLSDALATDPNNKGASGSFGTMAQYFPLRIASMRDQLPAAPPPPAEPGQIHVGDLDGSSVSTGRNNWDALVKVTVHDYMHDGNVNVADATVTGSWSGGVGGDTACVTDAFGQCSLGASVTKKKLKKVSFTISNVSLGGSIYVAGQNHDDEGDSDGNSVTVSKP
jgi:hypothetical protein